MRFSECTAVAVLLMAMSAASAQPSVASVPATAVAKIDVLRPGTGSFASYLSQSAGAPAAPSQPAFVLRKGEMVHEALEAWAKAAGWELIWYPDVSWKVLGDTTFAGITDVTQAVAEVVTILRDERRPVRLEIADGNRIMEVISTDVVSNREAFSD